MGGSGGKPSGDGGKKSKGGGFWGFVNKVLDNVSVNVNVAAPGRAPTGNPTDPAARMEPVRADRKETYDEMVYRTTDGQRGQAPMVRVDRERETVARSLDGRHAGGSAGGGAGVIPRGGGEPLAKDVRSQMEPRLGADLSGVRVHRSGESATAAQALQAKAFTVGSDVHFGSGQYGPGTKEGDRLLAHELTHVVQGQKAGVQRKAEAEPAGEQAAAGGHAVSDPGEPAEQEADKVGDHVAEALHGGGAEHGGHSAAGSVGQAAPAVATKRLEGSPQIGAAYYGIGSKILRAKGPVPPKAPTPATAKPTTAKPTTAKPTTPATPDASKAAAPVRKVPIPTAIAGAQLTVVGGKLSITEGGAPLALKLAEALDSMAGARNPSIRQLLEAAGATAAAAQLAVGKVSVDAGTIDEASLPAVTAQATAAGGALLNVLKQCKVARTDEIRPRARTVQPAWKAMLHFGLNKIGDTAFHVEYDRQMSVHEKAMNALSVDEWFSNMEVHNLKLTDHFNQAEDATKQAMVAELKARLNLSKDQMERDSAQFTGALDLMKALEVAVNAADAPGANAALKKNAEDATKAFMTNDYVKRNFTGRILTPRQEVRFKKEHLAGLSAVVAQDQAKWTAAGDKRAWGTILHLPDQVAGGHGHLPTYKPGIPSPPAAGVAPPQAWIDYLEWLRNYIGSARVNSSIGGSWEQAARDLREQAVAYFKDSSPAAYPIYKVSIELSKSPNNS